jgi:lipopolysaccharide/colanic/teichoic acid biosynthesis glycosyltransferase
MDRRNEGVGTSPNVNGALGASARTAQQPGEDATIVGSRPPVMPSIRSVASRAAKLTVEPLLEQLPVPLEHLEAPVEPFVHDRAYLALKRALDVAATGVALVLLAPLFAAIALLIKLEDRGPVFFAQTRVGKGGRPFRFWKFRSMVVDAEARKAELKDKAVGDEVSDRLRFKMSADPRVTRVGRALRRFSLDELPQLWNVFRGDMTLVGPRPPIPEEVAEYGPRHRRRLELEQGLTCLWQVSGRNLLSFERQVELDIEYGRRRGLLFDVTLLLRTVPAVLSGRGAC